MRRHRLTLAALAAALLILPLITPATATAAPLLTLEGSYVAAYHFRASWTVDDPAAVLTCTLRRGDSVDVFACPPDSHYEFPVTAGQPWRFSVRASSGGQWAERWYESTPGAEPPAEQPTAPPAEPQPPVIEPPRLTDTPGVFVWPNLPSFGSVSVTRSGVYQLPARCTATNADGRQSGICQATLSVFVIKPGKRPSTYRKRRRIDYGPVWGLVEQSAARPRRLYLRGLARLYGRRIPVLAVLYHPSSGLTQSARGVLRLPRHDPPREVKSMPISSKKAK